MTIITAKQLENVSRFAREIIADVEQKRFTQAEREMFHNVCLMLGLTLSKKDCVDCVVPDINGQYRWLHAKRTVENAIRDCENQIALNNSTLEDMEKGFKVMDENLKQMLVKANKNGQFCVDYERKFIAEVEG